MENFRFYEYEGSKDSGIIFDKKIKIGDFEMLTKYKSIKYEENVRINDESEIFNGIVFHNISEESVQKIRDLFNSEWSTNKFNNFGELFSEIAHIFRKIIDDHNTIRYFDLLSELAFIKKSQLLGIQNILDFYSKNNFDDFDFNFKDSKYVDVKNGNILDKSFKLSLKQFKDLSNKKKLHDISIIFPNWDAENGMNLLDLYNSINGIKSFEYIREEIDEFYDKSSHLFKKYKIAIDKSYFIFFNKDLLPQIYLEEKKVLKNAAFEIFVTENTKINFESKIRELTGNE